MGGLHSDCLDLARFPLLLADLPNYPARIADGYVVGWDIPHDNAPGSNHAVVANRHARADDAMSPKPDIVPDVYGFRPLQPAASNLCINRVESGINMNARPNLSVIPDGDQITVKEHTPVIDEPVPTNADV